MSALLGRSLVLSLVLGVVALACTVFPKQTRADQYASLAPTANQVASDQAVSPDVGQPIVETSKPPASGVW